MPNKIIKQETAITLFGMPARAHNVVADTATGRIINQTIVASREFHEVGRRYQLAVELRFDDRCGNDHEDFAITGTLRELTYRGERGIVSCGCIHDDIEKHFPELAHLIRWHLVGVNGPMHYVGNTCYLAGNRDCWGKLKGEPRQWETRIKFAGVPFTLAKGAAFTKWLQAAVEFRATTPPTNPNHPSFEIVPVDHVDTSYTAYKFGLKYTFAGYPCKWHECPFDTLQEAEEFAEALRTFPVEFPSVATSWGEGKERELDAARRVAVWPDATDEELSVPREELEKALQSRLPALLAEFKADMLACGFLWPERKEA